MRINLRIYFTYIILCCFFLYLGILLGNKLHEKCPDARIRYKVPRLKNMETVSKTEPVTHRPYIEKKHKRNDQQIQNVKVFIEKKKIISFGLFASEKYHNIIPKWLERGIWANIKGYHKYFPEWICRFYITNSVNRELVRKIKSSSIPVEVIETEDWGHWSLTMMQRFLPFDDPDISHFMVRDLDSRPSMRELLAVNEWMGSDKKFHIIRDHSQHSVPIMGGTWAAKHGALGTRKIKTIFNTFLKNQKNNPMDDQQFLKKYIWPIVQSVSYQHDVDLTRSHCNPCHPFPIETPRWDEYFIGHAYKTDFESGRSFLFDQYTCFSTCNMGKLDCQCTAESYKMHNKKEWSINTHNAHIIKSLHGDIEKAVLMGTLEKI